ncbi:MAG: matrixin family metalloprotease [Dehalococcoidia bacterium]|nr:matrixin family metalloprotease [Dehalococcoidia bacterium]MCA9852205.1 matrixin family metalloprotease [Dehalococcoidia bacterium]
MRRVILATYVAMLLALAVSLGVIASPSGSSQEAKAYNTCNNFGYCGAHYYYSTVPWSDSTGWTGAKVTAMNLAGISWNYASPSLSLTKSTYCPCLANVGTVYQIGIVPGMTYTSFNPNDPYEVWFGPSYLNTFFTWYTDGTMDRDNAKADVRTVTLHEMGHWMYLNHDCGSHPSAVMCPDWTAKWSLTSDDINGMNALY